MKRSTSLLNIAMFFLFTCLSLITIAQDNAATQSTTTTKTTSTAFYMQPWAWVLGGIIVLVILIALFRGGGQDKTVTRTNIIK